MGMYLLVILLGNLLTCLCGALPSVSPPPTADTLPTEPTSELDLGQEWTNWKLQNEMRYENEEEDLYRRDVWLTNKMYIDEHNKNEARESGFKLAMNQFGDLTYSEWKELYLSHSTPGNFTDSPYIVKRLSTKLRTNTGPYPQSLDWRSKNAVSPVKSQGKCAASYAFSAMGTLEGAASLTQDKLVVLSEQNIIDCSVPYGNHGCHGGTVDKAYQYVISIGGVDTEDSYAFRARQGTCHYDKRASGTSMSGVIRLPQGNEKELLAAVTTVGPISISIDASSNSFRFYSSGVFNTIHCSTRSLNHAMVVTGYGVSETGQKYWLVKNSWGTSWGEKGYILMTRDNFNQCGIATAGSYPTL